MILSIRADAISSKGTPANEATEQNEISGKNGHLATPADNLTRVVDILTHPENMIRLNHISLNLTRMGVKVKESSSQSANQIKLTELVINDVWRRIIVLVKYPRDEMLSKDNLF